MSRGETGRLEHISFEIIALKVLEYLIENPDAQDTLEGITDWWLPHVDTQYQKSKIKAVLEDLTTKGVLIEHQQSGVPTYKISHTKKGEVLALLSLIKRENDWRE
jgi:hypothetical protein